EMGRAGYDARGIERDPLGPRLGNVVYGLEERLIRVGDAENLLPDEARADVVSCFSLLHHFVLGRASVDAAELVRLLDRVTPLVRRLVSRLSKGDDVFVAVHHDPTGPPIELATRSNVALVPDAIRCRWRGFELVQATWHCLNWAAATVPELSWVLLVSGQDYP